jgi:glycosyltransferase involved in cell wall biosynthesis
LKALQDRSCIDYEPDILEKNRQKADDSVGSLAESLLYRLILKNCEKFPVSSSISICIPTRNQAQYITDTLASAFAQTYPVSEVVVCDDASTDDTVAVVEAFRSRLSDENREKLKYHHNPVALKIGGNFAKAVSLCQGDFVIKVDSDDILEPNFAESLYSALKSHPQAGWAHCNVLRIAPDKTPLYLSHARKASGYTPAPELARLYLRRSDTRHCVMLRAEAYRQAGGYRPEMLTTEDRLLWIEMIMAGYGCYYSDQPLAKMREFIGRKAMSERLRDYVTSIRFMQAHLDRKWDDAVSRQLGLPKDKALQILRSSLYQTCLSLSLGEEDKPTRELLLDEAHNLAQRPVARIRVSLYQSVPRKTIIHYRELMSMPRRLLRALYIRFARR